MKIQSFTQEGFSLSEEKYIDIVRSIGESLTHLDIESRSYDNVGNILLALTKCAPNLLSVKLSGAISLDDDGVKALLAGCKKIETFELDTSRTYSKRVFLPESVRNTLTNAIKNVVILDFIEPTAY
jgi:hypothetical protein